MNEDAVPSIFRSLSLRSGRYQNLSHHEFTLLQVDFLINELLRNTAYLPRNDNNKLTAKDISIRCNINYNTIRSWKSRSTDDNKAITLKRGRSPNLDDISVVNLAKEVDAVKKMKKIFIFT